MLCCGDPVPRLMIRPGSELCCFYSKPQGATRIKRAFLRMFTRDDTGRYSGC